MDIFDRLGDLLRSFLNESESRISGADRDYTEALEELNRYMEGDVAEFTGPRARSEKRGFRSTYRGTRASGIPEELRQDYRNLELDFGAPMDAVRKKYRRLMVSYHPDRFAGDSRKARIATEITKKLGESYRRIREFHEGKRPMSR